MIKSLYQSGNTPIYLLLFVSLLLLNFTDLEFITTQEVYNAYQEKEIVEKYGDKYTDEFADDLSQDYEELTLSDYLSDLAFDSIFIFFDTLRIPYIAFFLLICFEFVKIIPNVGFIKLYKTVLIAEFVFVMQHGFQQLYLALFRPNYSMEDIIYSKPLALSSILQSATPKGGFLGYLVSYIDLFVFGYVFLIAFGLSVIYSLNLSKVIGWVILAYIASQAFSVVLNVLVFYVLL